jgi:hypothetical protein
VADPSIENEDDASMIKRADDRRSLEDEGESGEWPTIPK